MSLFRILDHFFLSLLPLPLLFSFPLLIEEGGRVCHLFRISDHFSSLSSSSILLLFLLREEGKCLIFRILDHFFFSFFFLSFILNSPFLFLWREHGMCFTFSDFRPIFFSIFFLFPLHIEGSMRVFYFFSDFRPFFFCLFPSPFLLFLLFSSPFLFLSRKEGDRVAREIQVNSLIACW